MRRAPRGGPLHPDCREAVTAVGALLESLGHEVEESHPAALDDPAPLESFIGVVTSSVAHALDAWGRKIGREIVEQEVEPLTWAMAESGRRRPAPEYIAAVESSHAHGRSLARWWDQGFDLLLTPTCAEPPPPLGSFAATPDDPLAGFLRAAPFGAFTLHFNISGQPAISLPLRWNEEGLPIGVQLVAAYGREDLLIRIAAQIEQAEPWIARLPPVHASQLTSD
jgi:amidase